MPSPGKSGGKSTLPLPASEGQENHSPSGTLVTPSISGNTTTPSHREGEAIDQVHPRTTGLQGGLTTHSNTAEFRSIKEARPTRQESLPSGSTGLGWGGSELLPSSNIRGPSPNPSVEHGPRVEVRVLGPDPRRTHNAVSERPSAVIDSEKKVVTLTGPGESKGTFSPQQRRPDDLQSNEVERGYKEPPSKKDYRERSPLRATGHRDRYSPNRRAASPQRGQIRSEHPRGLSHSDYWRPGEHNGGPSDRESRPPPRAQSSSFRVDTVSRGTLPRHRSPTRSPPHWDRHSRASHRLPLHYSPSRGSRSRRSTSPKRSRHVSGRSTSPKRSTHVSGRSASPKRSRHVSGHSTSPKRSRHVSGRSTSPKRSTHVSGRSASPKRSRHVSGRSTSPKRSAHVSGRSASPKRSRHVSGRSTSPKRSRHVSHRSPREGAPDPRKPLGGDPQEENVPQRHGRRGSGGERVISSAHDRSMGSQSRPKDSIQGGYVSISASKTASRGRIEDSSGDGGIGEKPCAPAGPDFCPTAETSRAMPSTLVAAPSPKGFLLKPAKSTSTPFGTNTTPSANTTCASTVAPETMGSLKSFANNAPGGPVPLSVSLLDSPPQKSTAPSKTASPSVAQEIPKPPPHPNVSPEFDAEYLKDREMSRQFLGISGSEFDAEMARRTAYLNANIARRKALEHPIHRTQAAQPGRQNPPGDNSKTSEGSRDANQMDTSPDNFTSHLKTSTHVNSEHPTSPGPEGLISQTHEPKADAKGKGKQKAEISDPDNDFSKENLWPGADSLDGLGSFTSLSPRWQSGSASFVAGAPEYHIPRGFFGSSPEPFIPASPTPFSSNQKARKPKYVDRASSPDKDIMCATCGPPLTISLTENHAALYNVHLKDNDELSHILFTNGQKDYYLFHVLTFPPYKSRLIYSDKIITLRDFTKVVRLGFDFHHPITQITVYLYGRDSDGSPLNWKPIHIMSVHDWDGAMSVSREWSCQVSVVIEFLGPVAGPARAATRLGPESAQGGAGPSRQTGP